MKIIRNGIEYELTYQEMRSIYNFMDLEYLKADIESKAEDMEMDISEYDLNKIASKVNKTLENNDSYWESYWMSIEYVLEDAAKEA